MIQTRTARRTASTLGAASLLALLLAAPAAARPDPGTGGRDFNPSTTQLRPQTRPEPVPPAVITDNTAEYVQVGAGVLAGIALAGAGVAVASRRRHQTPTTA